ncbi:MAG: sigma-70 family RNA polymerase sigma factor [Flavobacteriales bacterium]|nr:sigma-70 family RNA polymerase sigma factor [Flavobacteriales bacterium]
MNPLLPSDTILTPSLWMKRYFQNMYAYTASHIGADHFAAQDIVQDTFLSALNSMELFRGMCSEKTWLYSILRHRITDYYRHRSHHNTVTFSALNSLYAQNEDFTPWENNIPCHEPTPEHILENKQLGIIINDSIKLLPSRQRRVFEMKNIEDAPSHVICGTLRLSEENYWILMYRARRGLRALLLKKLR